MGTVTMAFIGQSENLHIMTGMFPLNNLYLAGNTLILLDGGQAG